ncbi:uncharacterized protein LOC118482602 [Helianthus annuus]|uniref:uncharacterized protein LOC118482602 n=1 Tax=Helianthus annuus TaxID=4232 RepID=UPI001652C0A5|nr:uncharacterized protein LOC118482602 [Helianthus annuus]
MSSEHEVHTSDYTSTDDDDFRHPLVEIPAPIPFAYEPIDGDPAEYLPIVAIPAPIPLAAYPAYELMPDADADGDIELYEDEPFEDEDPDVAPLPAGFCAGSSSFSPPNKFKVPDLNIYTDEENYDVLNDYQPNPDNSFEKCLPSSTITFEAGQVFNNKEEMKLELQKKCLLERFEFKVDRSSKTRYEVSCLVDGCVWRFRAYSFGDSGLFFVKSFNDKHTCSKTLTYPHLRQANPKVVAHYLKEPLKDSGRIYRCNEIVKGFRQRFQVEITTSQAWRGKSLALELLQGTSRDSFVELPFYCYNIERANPGSVTHIKTDDERRFKMVFVAIGAAIRTFFCNLRLVVIIDAAHLKGEFKGTLFLAVGMDGNNQILPISYGIGKSEDGESWTWFLSKLKECIGEIPNMAIISDRANSIHLAVRNVFPHAYHGLCCRHLMMNLPLPSDKKK